MKTDHLLTSAALIFAMVCTMPVVSASTNPALSNRTFVDTRGQQDGVPKLVDTTPTPSDGRRFISYEMAKQALTRPVKDTVTVYLQLQMPEFAFEKGGWGTSQAGMGTFYGLEMKTFSKLTPADTIRYKVGGAVPTPDTPASDWKSMDFNSIIDIDLSRQKKTYYFKIVLAAEIYGIGGIAPGPLSISARFQSARLCNEKGGPVTALDVSRPLWMVAHGRVDGESRFRTMNKAVQKAVGPTTQVVSLDWSNVAADKESLLPLQAGRYFKNLGRNMAGLLNEKGFPDNSVNWVGHSWGTLVGYETARAVGKVNQFVALDPATAAWGGYGEKDDRVNFGKVSAISTSVKGGGTVEGAYGSETKAKTSDFSVRLYSESHTGDRRWWSFYHDLPRSWFIRAMDPHNSNVYWPFFSGVLLRAEPKSLMPWGKYDKVSGFDLECHGTTEYTDGESTFWGHDYLLYQAPVGKKIEARARKNATGSLSWAYKKH